MPNSNVDNKAILRRAREIITNPVNWTTHAFRSQRWYDANNKAVDQPISCYCALGAVGKAVQELAAGSTFRDVPEAVNCLVASLPADAAAKLRDESYVDSDQAWKIADYNDSRAILRKQTTHADVLALFDRAIEAC